MSVVSMKPWASLIEKSNKRVYKIGQHRTQIGSALTSDLRIADTARKQAEIYWIATRLDAKYAPVLRVFTLQPPTYVNKKLITKSTILHTDDLITFGICRQHTFVFRVEEEDAVATEVLSANETNTSVGSKTVLGATTRHPVKRNLKQEFNSIAVTESLESTTNQTPARAKSKLVINLSCNLTPKFSPSIRNYFRQINSKSLQILEEIEKKYLLKESTDKSLQSMIIDKASNVLLKQVSQQEIDPSHVDPISSTTQCNASLESAVDLLMTERDLGVKQTLSRETSDNDNSEIAKQQVSEDVALPEENLESSQVNSIRDLCQRRDSERVEISRRYNSATLTQLRRLFVNHSPKADYDTHVSAVREMFGQRTPLTDYQSHTSHIGEILQKLTPPLIGTNLFEATLPIKLKHQEPLLPTRVSAPSTEPISELYQAETPTAPEADYDRYANVMKLVENGNLLDRHGDIICDNKLLDRCSFSTSGSLSQSLSFEITKLSKSCSTPMEISGRYCASPLVPVDSSPESSFETRLSLLLKVPDEYLIRSELLELNNLDQRSQRRSKKITESLPVSSSYSDNSADNNESISSLCISSQAFVSSPRELGDQRSSPWDLPSTLLSQSKAKGFGEAKSSSIKITIASSAESIESGSYHSSPSTLPGASLSESSYDSLEKTSVSLQINELEEPKSPPIIISIASLSMESSGQLTSASLSKSAASGPAKTELVSIKIPVASLALESNEQLSPVPVQPGTSLAMSSVDSSDMPKLSSQISKSRETIVSQQEESIAQQSPVSGLPGVSLESSDQSVDESLLYPIKIAISSSSLESNAQFSHEMVPNKSVSKNSITSPQKSILSLKMSKFYESKSSLIKISNSSRQSTQHTSPLLSESTVGSFAETDLIMISTALSSIRLDEQKTSPSVLPGASLSESIARSLMETESEFDPSKFLTKASPLDFDEKQQWLAPINNAECSNDSKLVLSKSLESIVSSGVSTNQQWHRETPPLESDERSPTSKLIQHIQSRLSIASSSVKIAKQQSSPSSLSNLSPLENSNAVVKKAKSIAKRYNLRTRGASKESTVNKSNSKSPVKKRKMAKQKKQAKKQKEAKFAPKEKKQANRVTKPRVVFSDKVKVHLLKCSAEDNFEPLSTSASFNRKKFHSKRITRQKAKKANKAFEELDFNDEF